MHIPKWLIATAGFLLMTLIAAVAFLIGRDSAPTRAVEAPASVETPAAPAVKDAPPEAPAPAAAEAVGSSAPVVTPAPSNSIASLPGASAPAAITPPVAPDARARVAAYFAQMDAIESGGMAGNEEELANTIVTAALGGNFSGIDDLVRSAGESERRAVLIQPPNECAEYHQQVMTLLRESRNMVTTLRDGLKRNDADALTSIGASAQSMKSRAESLTAAGKALRARYGL